MTKLIYCSRRKTCWLTQNRTMEGREMCMEVIQSEQNQWLKRCRALQQKKYRQQYRQFVAEGLRFVQEALQHDAAQVVLVDEQKQELLQQLQVPEHTLLYLVKAGLLDAVLHTVHPQGHCRHCQTEPVGLAGSGGDETGGHSGRSAGSRQFGYHYAHGAGFRYGGRDVPFKGDSGFCITIKTLRATMGAVFRLPVYQIDDVETMQADLHRWGFQLAVADVRAQQDYYEMEFPEKTALVVSNEANGPQLIKQGDLLVKIPLYQQAESLNVAVAAGILLYAIRTSKEGK